MLYEGLFDEARAKPEVDLSLEACWLVSDHDWAAPELLCFLFD